jgi:hypothetical protein
MNVLTPESMIAQIRGELVADYADSPAPRASALDQAADTAVRALWGARVTAFVPLLALRDAREALRAQMTPVAAVASASPTTRPNASVRGTLPARDLLRIDDDVLRHAQGDRLSV